MREIIKLGLVAGTRVLEIVVWGMGCASVQISTRASQIAEVRGPVRAVREIVRSARPAFEEIFHTYVRLKGISIEIGVFY